MLIYNTLKAYGQCQLVTYLLPSLAKCNLEGMICTTHTNSFILPPQKASMITTKHSNYFVEQICSSAVPALWSRQWIMQCQRSNIGTRDAITSLIPLYWTQMSPGNAQSQTGNSQSCVLTSLISTKISETDKYNTMPMQSLFALSTAPVLCKVYLHFLSTAPVLSSKTD